MVKATAIPAAKRNNVLICKISFVNLVFLTARAGNHFEKIELCLNDWLWTGSSELVHRCLAGRRRTFCSLGGVRGERLGIQGQLVRHLILRQEADPVLTEAFQNKRRIGLRISERSGRKFKVLRWRTRTSKCIFQSCRTEQSEQANPRGADRKCVWFQSRKKNAFSLLHFESLLTDVHVKLSFENVEEFVFARVLVRGRLISGRERCLNQTERSVCILFICKIRRQARHVPP